MKARQKRDLSVLNGKGSANFFYNKHNKSLEKGCIKMVFQRNNSVILNSVNNKFHTK
jgi:hypothetical protein